MENYFREKVVDVEDQTGLPFGDLCPTNVIHMKVKSGTKVKNIVDYSVKHFVDNRSERKIVINGTADASNKVISCAEILKQNFINKLDQYLYQMTKICYKTVEEFWKPVDQNLDTLKVVRKIPQIFVLLSKDALDLTENGVQYKDHNISNQSMDKNNFKSNKFKQNKSKQKSRQKQNRKSGNPSTETIDESKPTDTQS